MRFLQTSLKLLAFICSAISTTQTAYTGPTTNDGVNLIKSFESFQPNFYTDPVGIKTIGYGYACHVNPCGDIKPPLTEAQATIMLKKQLKTFENCINQNVKYANLNAAQFSANDVSGAAQEFAKWNKGGGKVLPGLTRRRTAEKNMFCSNKVC